MMVIALPPEIEHALVEAAQQLGISPERLALASLQDRFIKLASVAPVQAADETLFDFLQGFIGVLHSGASVPGGANMSQNSRQKFTELLLAK